MNCIVTAGPTYEPLDEVRRLTNMSTGRLGSLLASYLSARGHQVTLLMGHYATWRGEQQAATVETYTTTADLRDRLEKFSGNGVDAVFHAAAVSDFGFGKIYERGADGTLQELNAGKIPTRGTGLLAELVPTPKVIARLRPWFPQARIVGWKYEVDGDRDSVLERSREQIAASRTDGCVANGPAYGFGFGVVAADGQHRHFSDTHELFAALEALVLAK